jgi:hypothetical protein
MSVLSSPEAVPAASSQQATSCSKLTRNQNRAHVGEIALTKRACAPFLFGVRCVLIGTSSLFGWANK